MPVPSIDRLPNWRPQGADLYSTGASGAVPVRPVNPVNSVESVDRQGEGVVVRSGAESGATSSDPLPGLYSARGTVTATEARIAGQQADAPRHVPDVVAPGAAQEQSSSAATAAIGAVTGSAGGAGQASTTLEAAPILPDKTAARTGEAVNQPSNADPSNQDWTTRQSEQKKEEAKQAEEPPKEPISKQLLDFLHAVWRASGAAVDLAQQTSSQAGQDRQNQDPLRTDPLTYTAPPSVKKSS